MANKNGSIFHDGNAQYKKNILMSLQKIKLSTYGKIQSKSSLKYVQRS